MWGFRLWHIFLHLLPTVPDAPALATWTGQRDFCRKLEFTNAVTPYGRMPIFCSDGQLFSGMTDKTFVSVSVFHDAVKVFKVFTALKKVMRVFCFSRRSRSPVFSRSVQRPTGTNSDIWLRKAECKRVCRGSVVFLPDLPQ